MYVGQTGTVQGLVDQFKDGRLTPTIERRLPIGGPSFDLWKAGLEPGITPRGVGIVCAKRARLRRGLGPLEDNADLLGVSGAKHRDTQRKFKSSLARRLVR